MGRKVFHIAKLRSRIETNKRKHEKVAIFFLRVKNRISKEENSNKKEALSSIEERKQYFCVSQKRERKYLPKFFPSSPSFLSIFSITPLGVFLFVRLFVCSFVRLFVCLLNARTRARKRVQVLHLQDIAHLHKARKDTRKEKNNKKHVQVLHLQELACLLTARKGTRKEKNNKKHVQVLHLQELACLLTAQKGTRKEKTNKKHVQVLHLQELACLLTARKDIRREKTNKKHVQVLHLQELACLLTARKDTKREKTQKKTHASSSFAGYSTRFRGTFSLFLARKTLKNDFTHWNIVQMKIFQGLYSRISRSER